MKDSVDATYYLTSLGRTPWLEMDYFSDTRWGVLSQ